MRMTLYEKNNKVMLHPIPHALKIWQVKCFFYCQLFDQALQNLKFK